MENHTRVTQPAPSFSFREGKMADHPRCAELWMDALALRDGTARDPQVRQRALAKLTMPGGILAIAESDSMIHGFALATDRTPPKGVATAHLTLLAVDPTIQARGLGRALLADTTRSLEIAGFVEATLSVLEQNVAARKIYEDAGWQVTGEGVFEDSGRPCVHYLLRLRHWGRPGNQKLLFKSPKQSQPPARAG